MNVIIHPKKLKGDVIIPPSKSLSHRAIIAACLAEGESVISNISFSKDINATIGAMEALGAKVVKEGNTLYITGSKIKRVGDLIDANESGSTIRFMIPIALVSSEPITFSGKNHLVNRPLDSYFEIFDKLGITYTHPTEAYLPLHVNGGLKSGIYEMRGDISSQFITGLLYALPLLDGDSKIVITTNMESIGYIDLTLDVLKDFGIKVINNNYKEFIIEGNQKYKPNNYTVEGDYSQTAFYLVGGALGNDINLLGMKEYSLQGDKKIIEDIKSMNGDVTFINGVLKCNPSDTIGSTIDFSQSPDLGPALTVLASLSEGTSHFVNASRLRIKECDRITCMLEELNKMGASITETYDTMTINGVKELKGCVVDSHNDHRIAMALAMAASVSNGDVKILNAECVSKSYPHFWEDYIKLGGSVDFE